MIDLELHQALNAWNDLTPEQRRFMLTEGGYETPADAMRALGYAVPANPGTRACKPPALTPHP